MSAHVVAGARKDFRKTRKAPKVRKAPEFSQFSEKSLGRFWQFSECCFNDAHRGGIPNNPFGALSNEKGAYPWRIMGGVHPCHRMSSIAPGWISENAESAESAWVFAIFGEIGRGVLALSSVDF